MRTENWGLILYKEQGTWQQHSITFEPMRIIWLKNALGIVYDFVGVHRIKCVKSICLPAWLSCGSVAWLSLLHVKVSYLSFILMVGILNTVNMYKDIRNAIIWYRQALKIECLLGWLNVFTWILNSFVCLDLSDEPDSWLVYFRLFWEFVVRF